MKVLTTITGNRWQRHRRALLASFAKNFAVLQSSRYLAGRKHAARVAIGLAEHLGDVVACEPVAEYLKQKHPGARLYWCVRKPYREVPQSFRDVDSVIGMHCLSEWIYLCRYNAFDVVYDLHLAGKTCSTCGLVNKYVTKHGLIDVNNYYEHGCLLRAMTAAAGIDVPLRSPHLTIPDQITRKVDLLELPKHFVVCHTSGNELARDWEPSKWTILASRITKEIGLPIVEIGLSPQLVGASGSQYINLCGKLSILESAEVIRRSALFVGIDSGPAHLAHAVGASAVILLGSYRAFKSYTPYAESYADGSMATIVRSSQPASHISVEEAFVAVRDRVAKDAIRDRFETVSKIAV